MQVLNEQLFDFFQSSRHCYVVVKLTRGYMTLAYVAQTGAEGVKEKVLYHFREKGSNLCVLELKTGLQRMLRASPPSWRKKGSAFWTRFPGCGLQWCTYCAYTHSHAHKPVQAGSHTYTVKPYYFDLWCNFYLIGAFMLHMHSRNISLTLAVSCKSVLFSKDRSFGGEWLSKQPWLRDNCTNSD